MMIRAWEQPALRPSERLVLLALADCADREGHNAFKSVHAIAEHTWLDLRTVKRALKSLRTKELICMTSPRCQHRPPTYQVFPAARGDRLSPLKRGPEVTSEVTNPHIPGGSFTGSSLDPLLDPVDPGLLTLLTKTVDQQIAANPGASPDYLVSLVARYTGARGWPVAPDLISRAITQRRKDSVQ